MPPVYTFQCNNCEFTLPLGWGACMYVTDDNGKRITCPHPCEDSRVVDTIGVDKFNEIYEQQYAIYEAHFPKLLRRVVRYFWKPLTEDEIVCIAHPLLSLYEYKGSAVQHMFKELYEERSGVHNHCVCLDCLQQSNIDLERDERKCQHCGSSNVTTAHELVDKPCPKCKTGTIEPLFPI